jgi:hypothetical protein
LANSPVGENLKSKVADAGNAIEHRSNLMVVGVKIYNRKVIAPIE